MAKAYYLSEDDRQAIADMLGKQLQQRGNAQLRDQPQDFLRYCSDIYVAKVPGTGIPALTTPVGTGTGDADEPGSGSCTIYHVTMSGSTAQLCPITGLSKKVYNFGTQPVPAGWALVWLTKGGQWFTVPPQAPLALVPFELKTDLTPGGSADAYAMLSDGSDADTVSATFKVYDFYGNIRALGRTTMEAGESLGTGTDGGTHGARGLACKYPDDPGTGSGTDAGFVGNLVIVDCDRMAQRLTGALNDLLAVHSVIQSIYNVRSADGGQVPALTDGMLTAYNPYDLNGLPDQLCIVEWDENDMKWEFTAIQDDQYDYWGVVQAGFTNADGSASRTVSIKSCKYDGTFVTGAAFYVFTPIRPEKDTALFAGSLVRWNFDPTSPGGLIKSDIWDDPIGTVKMVTTTDAMRQGWTAYTPMTNRFPVGAGDAYAAEAVGGGNHKHGLDGTTYTTGSALAGVGLNVLVVTGAIETGGDTALGGVGPEPAYCGLLFIKRTS